MRNTWGNRASRGFSLRVTLPISSLTYSKGGRGNEGERNGTGGVGRDQWRRDGGGGCGKIRGNKEEEIEMEDAVEEKDEDRKERKIPRREREDDSHHN